MREQLRAVEASAEPAAGEARESAIPRLVELHGDQLYALGLRFCGDPEKARDLVQETFLLAYRKWHQFQGRARASTWLYAIAARVCQRSQRRKRDQPGRMRSLEELLPFGESLAAVAPTSAELEDLEERTEMLREVEQAIAELPVGFRMPLVLKEIAGLSIAEIAAVLGLRAVTIKTRLHRARLAVRKAIERGRPRVAAPPPIFDRQVCLDLLAAKQDALDRGVAFEFPDGRVCERCAGVFASLDLAQDACRAVGRGELPETLRRAILAHIAAQKFGHSP